MLTGKMSPNPFELFLWNSKVSAEPCKINIPILDISGSEDIVKDLSLTRCYLIRQASHYNSKQIELKSAEHMFIDKGEGLTQKINNG